MPTTLLVSYHQILHLRTLTYDQDDRQNVVLFHGTLPDTGIPGGKYRTKENLQTRP